jgi:glycosyltransferase involved in cell wall biosynthesis
MEHKNDSEKAIGKMESASTVARESGKTRVVHITSIGLTARVFLLEHFRLLHNAGFEAILVCSDDEDARYCNQATGVRFIPVAIKQNIAPVSDLISLLRLWRLFRRLRPAIIDAHMSKAGVLGSLAGWLARVPVRIYHSHGMALLSARGWKYWLLRLTESIACRCATEIIFVSPSNKEDVINIGICPKDKAVVLGPGTISGIDTERFNPEKNAARGADLRKKAGIPEQSWLVGFVGRIVPHKGIETILEAWRLLPADIRSRAYLCIFGAPEHPRMQDLVEQAASEPGLHVKYMGFSNDLPGWYSTMTVLAQPSWHEGWGYNVLEAACNGVPSVGTRISATVDAILDGQTGLLVPVKDPQAMANAVTKLLKNDDLRKRLGQAARERTVNEFSQEKICPLLTEEYQRLLHRRKSHRSST